MLSEPSPTHTQSPILAIHPVTGTGTWLGRLYPALVAQFAGCIERALGRPTLSPHLSGTASEGILDRLDETKILSIPRTIAAKAPTAPLNHGYRDFDTETARVSCEISPISTHGAVRLASFRQRTSSPPATEPRISRQRRRAKVAATTPLAVV
jgi:hypothetical protein